MQFAAGVLHQARLPLLFSAASLQSSAFSDKLYLQRKNNEHGGKINAISFESSICTGHCCARNYDMVPYIYGQLFGVLILIADSTRYGIGLLILAFLVSPYGLPMLAAWLVGKLHGLRYAIQDWLY